MVTGLGNQVQVTTRGWLPLSQIKSISLKLLAPVGRGQDLSPIGNSVGDELTDLVDPLSNKPPSLRIKAAEGLFHLAQHRPLAGELHFDGVQSVKVSRPVEQGRSLGCHGIEATHELLVGCFGHDRKG
jgi:hypothetical protein